MLILQPVNVPEHLHIHQVLALKGCTCKVYLQLHCCPQPCLLCHQVNAIIYPELLPDCKCQLGAAVADPMLFCRKPLRGDYDAAPAGM